MPTDKEIKATKEALVLDYVKTKNNDLKGPIAELYKPLIYYVARKLSFDRNDLDDLVQVGSMGLLRALDRFDPSMETDFSTFATPNIIGEIKHYFRDKKNLVKIPRRLQELYSKVKRILKETQVMGISLTYQEIADELDVTEEQVLECMEAGKATAVVSLDSPAHYASSGDSGSSLVESLGGKHQEDFYINRVTLNEALGDLNEREKKIIYLRFYTGLSQTEIAERMNLSQMHISRLLTKALDVLKKKLEQK